MPSQILLLLEVFQYFLTLNKQCLLLQVRVQRLRVLGISVDEQSGNPLLSQHAPAGPALHQSFSDLIQLALPAQFLTVLYTSF
jgi:hypothetical protein